MMGKRAAVLLGILLAAVLLLIGMRRCGRRRGQISSIRYSQRGQVSDTGDLTPSPPPPVLPKPALKAIPKPVPPVRPPAVKIHKELIPKDIEIVRVYYPSSLTGPGSSIAFDINGSGFTKEFEQMIKVESGSPDVAVQNLGLVTKNQIRGTLVINEKAATGVVFPRVLIQGKVVFQAEDPFAVIRPGEVLNLIFTEMGETGRTGRFRIFTNLTPEMAAQFSIAADTPAIAMSDLAPSLPFVVDGTVNIGAAQGGDYGILIKLGEKVMWEKKGILRVVRPNLGKNGLIQHVKAVDGFHRPGDTARFSILGSGFEPENTALLKARVKELDPVNNNFAYFSPGRMELVLSLPLTAPTSTYTLQIFQGEEMLIETPAAFRMVPNNWTRGLKLDPPLLPGATSTLVLSGRDLDSSFIGGIKVEMDEPGLSMGGFSWVSPQEARASIAAASAVPPGDYLLKMTVAGKPVRPQTGSLIRVSAE